jgi:glycosyltransferase involved in cell wall biosynthesis
MRGLALAPDSAKVVAVANGIDRQRFRAREGEPPCRFDDAGDRDGVPNVLLEAMAVGVPVIAGAAGGVAEAVEDGQSGLLVEPESPELLADAIERVLGDSELRARLVAGGFERTGGLDVVTSVVRLRALLAEAAASAPVSARRPGR